MDKGRLLNLARKFKQIYESGKPYIPDSSWTLTQHQRDHDRRVERAQRLLSLEHIPRLTDDELRELFADTDALGFFKVKTKKDKVLDQLLSGEGTEGIRSVLLSLFQKAEAELTPDAFLEAQEPHGVGPLLISELLSHRFPSRYYPYSSRTLPALKILGEDVRAAQPHGKRGDHYLYFAIRPLMEEICNALREVGLTEVDYMLADMFVVWVGEVKPPNNGPLPPEDGLTQYFASQGLHFTPYQLATFYTALKTKGFVILTGISGTGKTKLAQYFAELLGSKDQFHFAVVRPDWRDSKSLLGYFNPLLGKEGQFQSTGFLQFLLQAYGNYRSSLHELKWEADGPYASTLLAEPNAFNTDTVRLGLKAVNAGGQVVAEGTFEFIVNEGRQLALPERISELQPFRNAAEIYALELDRVSPYFVLLDEMNLAKVEYYFADFLSVLESGRREDGFTREAIRFQYPEDIDGPPRELYLPPNLYFIGTVNVDETTYMFSPKVLDRAFTLELGTVNLEDCPGEQGEPLSDEALEQLRAQLLPDFTRQGQFAVVDKTRVAEFAATHSTYRQHLSTLNALLQPHGLHFGYRVFDEIMMFLANAEGSPVFDGFGPDGLDAVFDAAVLMKVLPKFHGTRGKLREPLEKIVWWAREPNNPEAVRQALSDELQDTERMASLREDLRKRIEGSTTGESSAANDFAYPRMALKALRMLHNLYTTGFASFA